MFSLKEIISAVDAKDVSLNTDISIKRVSTDSRRIKRGELFIALSGENFNGADFVNEAIRKGASAIILNENIEGSFNVPVLRVSNTEKALGDIARCHRSKYNIPVIGITGSNGKTQTKEMLSHVLSNRFKVLKTEKNYNNKIGVSLTLLNLKDEDVAVVEVGTSLVGEIEYNSSILKPTISIVTNIGPSHLETFRDLEGVLKEKISIVESLGKKSVWIKNADDLSLQKKTYPNIKEITYGIDSDYAEFKAVDIKESVEGLRFSVKTIDFYLPLLGKHNIYNALSVVSCASMFMDIKSIRDALATFTGTSMRMELLECEGFKIINDTYNSNPLSLRSAVNTLSQYKTSGRKILISADMLELGGDSDKLHKIAGKFIADNADIDLLITHGRLSKFILEGALANGMAKDKTQHFDDKDDIKLFLKTFPKENDILLIKGSRGMKMEEIINCFTTCSIH